jgi:hypothetical protein
MVKTMAKSTHQKLLRMQKRHSLWSVYGIPSIFNENGTVIHKLESGTILDLRTYTTKLIVAINPTAEERNHYENTDCVQGMRLYIEKLTKYKTDWNIEFRILTMNGWEHA